jgi:hypothetical protein
MHVETPQSLCHVGLARCDVTPDVGTYHRMWGAATHDRSTGVHRPLTATALVLKSSAVATGQEELAIVDIDHCLLWASEMEDMLRSVCEQTGLAREQVLFAFTHTHGAGLMDRTRRHLPGGDKIGPYLERTAKQVADVIQNARCQMQEAVLTYGVGHCDLAAQRDLPDPESNQIVCGYNPAEFADDTVTLVRITDRAGKKLATVVNYACHPTTLAWENTRISPDYVGALRETVEQATGARCVFLQGASGDLGPKEGFVGDTAVADRNGRRLGWAVLSALEALPPPLTRFRYRGPVVSGATLGPWDHVPLDEKDVASKRRWQHRRLKFDLPYRPDLPTIEQARSQREHWLAEEENARAAGDSLKARDAHAMVERQDRLLTRLASLVPGPTFPFPVTLLRLGDAFWVFVEGEHYQMLQCRLRERFPGVPIVVNTLSNGSRCFYVVPREAYGKGIYQEAVAMLAPGTLESLIESIGNAIAES